MDESVQRQLERDAEIRARLQELRAQEAKREEWVWMYDEHGYMCRDCEDHPLPNRAMCCEKHAHDAERGNGVPMLLKDARRRCRPPGPGFWEKRRRPGRLTAQPVSFNFGDVEGSTKDLVVEEEIYEVWVPGRPDHLKRNGSRDL